MAITVKITEVHKVELDLHTLQVALWPQRAKDLAIYIMRRDARKLEQELPDLRKAYVIARVEALYNLSIEDL